MEYLLDTGKERLPDNRLSLAVTPTWPSRPGKMSLILSHWSSRKAYRRMGQGALR